MPVLGGDAGTVESGGADITEGGSAGAEGGSSGAPPEAGAQSQTGGAPSEGGVSSGGTPPTNGGGPEYGGAPVYGGAPTYGGTGTGGDPGVGGYPVCWDGVIEGNSLAVDTRVTSDRYTPSCAIGSAQDAVYQWTAPFTDYFTFDSAGSSFDTVVAVYSGDCPGSEIACSNDFNATPQGRAVASVQQGQPYLVVLSGNSGENGSGSLSIAEVTCPAATLSAATGTYTTVGGSQNHAPPCYNTSITDQPEKAFRFTAPSAGLYRFAATSVAFAPVLSLYDGPVCGGTLLGCNYNVGSEGAYPAEVTRYLTAGQSVTLIVEGENAAGSFDLSYEKLVDNMVDGCANLPQLGSGASGIISTSTHTHEIGGSCNWAGSAGGGYNEARFQFTVNQTDPANRCGVSVTFGTLGGTVIVLPGNQCAGPELVCRLYEPSGDDVLVSFGQADNGVYTLIVDATAFMSMDQEFTVTSTCD